MKQYLSPLSLARCLSLAVVVLAGCGGGGGGGSADGGPTESAQDFLSTGFSNHPRVLVLDPAQPEKPRFALGTTSFRFHDFWRVDQPTGRVRFVGTSRIYFIQNHQVFQLSLRKTDPTVPQQISSLKSACSFGYADLDSVEFADWWLSVVEAGPDGDCDKGGDNRVVYVRSGMPADANAVQLPEGVELTGVLATPEGTSPQFFVAVDQRGGASSSKLTLYGPTLLPLGDVVGGNGVNDFSIYGGHRVSQGATQYTYGLADTLRRLSWDDRGATLSAAVHTYVGPDWDFMSNGSNYYFVDGASIFQIEGMGSPKLMGKVPSTRGNLRLDFSTLTHLLVSERLHALGLSSSLYSVPKVGGDPVLIASGEVATPLGMVGDELVYQYVPKGLRVDGPLYAEVRRVKLDGSADTLVASGQGIRLILQRESDLLTFPPQVAAIMWCQSTSDDSSCRNGEVKMLDFRNGSTTSLGHFSVDPKDKITNPIGYGYATLPDFQYIDEPILFWTSTSWSGDGMVRPPVQSPDYYFVRNGVPNSLTHVPALP